MEWKPGRSLVAELHGAHGDLELDQQGLPWSLTSIVTGHKVAQVGIAAIGSKGCSTSIVKKERFLKAGHRMGGLHWVYNNIKRHTARSISPTGFGPKCPRFG